MFKSELVIAGIKSCIWKGQESEGKREREGAGEC